MRITGSPGFNGEQRSEEQPISSTTVESSPASISISAPVSASPSIAKVVPSTRSAKPS
jgi:hypothetical protein